MDTFLLNTSVGDVFLRAGDKRRNVADCILRIEKRVNCLSWIKLEVKPGIGHVLVLVSYVCDADVLPRRLGAAGMRS